MNNLEYLKTIKKEARENYIPIMDDECEKVILEMLEKERPLNILEIGTCVGYSATVMLLVCNAHIDTIELDKARYDKAKKLFEEYSLLDRVTQYLGDVNVILDEVIKNKEYDFVFIDGPKSGYLNHLKTILPHVKSGSIIIADDVLFFGLVRSENKVAHKHRTIVRHLREFLEYIENSKEVEVNILDVGNGIAIMRKK